MPARCATTARRPRKAAAGKVYMVRDGLFDDVDAVVAWHPGDSQRREPDEQPREHLRQVPLPRRGRARRRRARPRPLGARRRRGDERHGEHDARARAAGLAHPLRHHQAAAPRSTSSPISPRLLLRRRNPDMRVLDGIWERIVNAAKGAALGTGTTMDLELRRGLQHPAEQLSRGLHAARTCATVGGVELHRRRSARSPKSCARRCEGRLPPLGSEEQVQPVRAEAGHARVHRPRRRELEGADRADDGRDVGARHPGAQLAGGGVRRHVDRREGDDGGREDDGADRRWTCSATPSTS